MPEDLDSSPTAKPETSFGYARVAEDARQGLVSEVFAKVARRFDLAIMGQPQPDTPALERLLVEAALFDSGRPVLIVPYVLREES